MKISLLIPAYNAASTLSETLDSVLSQTRPPDEVILVDDGSSDDTRRVVERHSCEVIVIGQPQTGPAAALNLAMQHASGDLFAFLDADDLWIPGKLERQETKLLEVGGDCDGVLGHVESFLSPVATPQEASRLVVPQGAQPGWLTGTLLVKAEVFQRIGYFSDDLTNGFAIDWFDRARSAGVRFHMSSHTVLRRRIHSGSLASRNARSDAAMLEMARRAIMRRRQGGN